MEKQPLLFGPGLVAMVPDDRYDQARAFIEKARDFQVKVCKRRVNEGESWRHGTLAEFYLCEGRAFKCSPLTWDEVEIVRTIPLKASAEAFLRSDFHNAVLTAKKLPRLDYAEGLAILDGVVHVHAWLVLNGKVIDPTWPIKPSSRGSQWVMAVLRRIAHNLMHRCYFGIVLPKPLLALHIPRYSSTTIIRPFAQGADNRYLPLRLGLDAAMQQMGLGEGASETESSGA